MRKALITAGLIATLALSAAPRAPARQEVSRDVTAGRGLKVRMGSGDEVELYVGSHALVIGVSAYSNGWSPLPGVEADVPAVSEVLEKNGFQVETLTGQDATSRGIRVAIEAFIDKYGYEPHNRLVIYFAGHGYTGKTALGERDLGYIIPSDTPLPNADELRFRQTAISMEKIEGYARQIEAKHALFVFDSCFSGTLLNTLRSEVPPGITENTSLPARQFITAGSDKQVVPDRSVFRQYFVKGLRGDADTNNDDYVTGLELYLYLHEHVTAERRKEQTPRYGSIYEGNIVFALPEATRGMKRAARREPVDPSVPELMLWAAVKDSDDPEDYKIYLEEYPDGRFSALARRRVAQGEKASEETAHSGSPKVAEAQKGVLTLDFDSINGRVPVPAGDYLNRFGVTVGEDMTKGSELVILDLKTFYSGQAVRASSGDNGLAHTKLAKVENPIVFTLKLPYPVQTVRFIRPKLIAATESGVTFPEWSVRALDAAGEVLDSTGEGLGSYFSDLPPRAFALNGAGITALRFTSNNHDFAAFHGVVIDDLTLILSAPQPAP
jgi:hypothetical protein